MKQVFDDLEDNRVTSGTMASARGERCGVFSFRPHPHILLITIVDSGEMTGWEHVSVVAHDRKKVRGKWMSRPRPPTWPEMCIVKDAFWSRDECVVQFHPRENEYVNNHQHCLHLWRHRENAFPTPPPVLVGFNDGAVLANSAGKEVPNA